MKTALAHAGTRRSKLNTDPAFPRMRCTNLGRQAAEQLAGGATADTSANGDRRWTCSSTFLAPRAPVRDGG